MTAEGRSTLARRLHLGQIASAIDAAQRPASSALVIIPVGVVCLLGGRDGGRGSDEVEASSYEGAAIAIWPPEDVDDARGGRAALPRSSGPSCRAPRRLHRDEETVVLITRVVDIDDVLVVDRGGERRCGCKSITVP